MGADYTDGGGWAKLDATAAFELAAIAGTFSPRSLEKQVRMLLVLYQSMSADGTISMGCRTLAERADVTKWSAERFIKKLEDNGDLVIVGEKTNSGGRYTVRRFAWLGGVSVDRDTPVSKTRQFRDTPVSKTRQFRDTSELLRSSQRAGGSATAAPTPKYSENCPPQEIDLPFFKQRPDLFTTEGGE